MPLWQAECRFTPVFPRYHAQDSHRGGGTKNHKNKHTQTTDRTNTKNEQRQL